MSGVVRNAMSPLADTVMVVRELIGRPGTSRQLDRRMPAPAELSDDIVTVGAAVTLSGVLESVVDGVLLRGRVEAPARVACVRCLTERDEVIGAEVTELYSKPDGTDDETVEQGYEIIDDAIDLDTLLRDALAAAAPAHPLCRPDCAGLCATCGADLNVAPCDGHPDQSDPRWSALDGLDIAERASASDPAGGERPDVHHNIRK
jgi:uncharacterized protein